MHTLRLRFGWCISDNRHTQQLTSSPFPGLLSWTCYVASSLGLSVHQETSSPSLNDSCAHAQVPITYVLSNWMIHVSGTDIITSNVIRRIVTLCTLCLMKHERGLELLQERLQIMFASWLPPPWPHLCANWHDIMHRHKSGWLHWWLL